MNSIKAVYAFYAFSVLLALLLQLIRIPEFLSGARPLWIALVFGYWALMEPRVSTLLPAFIVGIFCDVLFGSVLGQHALGLVLVVYFIQRLRPIFILFPLWQATLALIPLWFIYIFIMYWIDGSTQHQPNAWLRWLPLVSTTLFWPLVFATLESVMRHQAEE